MSWGLDYLVKSALSEWIGTTTAPIFGGAQGAADLAWLKKYGPHRDMLLSLSRINGLEKVKGVHGVEFAQTSPTEAAGTIYHSPNARRGTLKRTKLTVPWENIPSEARGHFVTGAKKTPFRMGNGKAFAEAAARGTEVGGRMSGLGMRVGAGAVGAGTGALILAAILKARQRRKEKEQR